MDSSKLAVKIFARDGSTVPPDVFVPIFHQWIQTRALPDHLLIDVADYKHVPAGPGTVLVAHEANFSTDSADNRLGLLYTRKQPFPGDLTARLRATFRAALQAVDLLEHDSALAGELSFRTDNPLFRMNDRLLAPNTSETFAAVKPALESFLTHLYGGPVTLSHQPDPERLFEVQIQSPSSPRPRALLEKI